MKESPKQLQALRDQFAGQAMQAWLTAALTVNELSCEIIEYGAEHNLSIANVIAKRAYDTAEAMMEERQQDANFYRNSISEN